MLLGLALALSAAGPAAAQVEEAVQQFDAGNRHYQQGAFAEAVRAYEAALVSGYASGALHYNLGNAYYRLDALGHAIRHYEKARRYLPDDAGLAHNLTIARSRIDPPISALPAPWWKDGWERYVLRPGAWPFFAGGLVLYLAGMGLLGWRIWTGTRDPWQRRARVATLGLAALLLAIAFAASLDRRLDRRAVVVAEGVVLLDAPAPEAPEARAVPEGVLVQVLGARDGWLEVRLPNGATGWLTAAAIADV